MDRPQVLRELHTLGGGRVINGLDDTAFVQPAPLDAEEFDISIRDFTTLYSDISDLGLTIIGCDFYHGGNEYNPPEWRPKNLRGAPAWICSEQGHRWLFLANSAFKRKQGLLYDICARISHQIRTCEWRLRQLSEAYFDQLNGRLKSGRFEAGQRFLDGHTSLCYLAFQAYLVDACVLRDYLAEFYTEVMLRPNDHKLKITAIKGLLKIWKSNPPVDSAGSIFKASVDGEGWLSELGAYRNLVVHTAPLASADRTLLSFTRFITLSNGQELPAIKVPIPQNPSEIIGSRSSEHYFKDSELGFARNRNFIDDHTNTLDALEYAHTTLQKLAGLCESIILTAPFEPEIPLITPSNFKINRGDNFKST
ncbi:hypothetical protein [Pseudomonas sp. LLC-1]|uniref:hypothetical protein n=1 Tax=Pseudomonas sp. LLC-1 TaxID=1812180 RepID=UPI0011B400B6|nr:hypothetical protein [Pseudomonas sp. LLC-1]